MIGIYKITNTINGKIYIGQSVNIEERLAEHKLIPFRQNRPTYQYPLYTDMRQYGVNNFSFEILEECKKKELNQKEQFYIALYDSYHNGYNQTLGGDHTATGDSSNHHILTEQQVMDIRVRYNNHETRWSVYQDYKDIISADTFSHIWLGRTWAWCMPEVFTKENKEWHNKNLGEPSLIGHSKLTFQDIRDIRNLKKLKNKRIIVYEKYKDKISFSAFNAIWYNQSWKGVE